MLSESIIEKSNCKYKLVDKALIGGTSNCSFFSPKTLMQLRDLCFKFPSLHYHIFTRYALFLFVGSLWCGIGVCGSVV